ncbi:hypothetical protein ACYSNO_07950 [Enterococcus sp. LJL98]
MKSELQLEKQIDVTAREHQTHIKLPFELESDYQSLKIVFTYGPQMVPEKEARASIAEVLPLYFPEKQPDVADFLPLMNFITLSLAYEGTYLGCRHHKQNRQEIIVSKQASSLGFLPFETKKGLWEIQLNLHSVRSDVVVQVAVYGEGAA